MEVTLRTGPIAEPEAGADERAAKRLRQALAQALLACLAFLPFGVVALRHWSRARVLGLYSRAGRSALVEARSWTISGVSTGVAVAVVAVILLTLTADDGAVYRTFLDPAVVAQNAGYLLEGFWLNV